MKEWTQAWLTYERRRDVSAGKWFRYILIEGFDRSVPIVRNALEELCRGVKGYFGVEPLVTAQGCEINREDETQTLLLQRVEVSALQALTSGDAAGRRSETEREQGLLEEGFCIQRKGEQLILQAAGDKGLLYGVFQLLRLCAQGAEILRNKSTEAEEAEIPGNRFAEVSEAEILRKRSTEEPRIEIPRNTSAQAPEIEYEGNEDRICVIPSNPFRMLNHWDNMDGSIERGYSGESFFFENNRLVVNRRTRDYARLAASVGLNAVVINNVNVKQEATNLITPKHYPALRELSALFAEYGISLFLSLNYASTIELGGLDSADPFDPEVIAWWKEKMAEVYENIPNFGGFLVKADSEGRPGPFTYGRTQADGANMLADIVKEYNSVIIWRCFVYNCQQDWRDYTTDRARAGYDSFIGMDGDYRDNVILQIKNGPIDFQVREPVSPLLGGLKHTNQMLEVQAAQEYTGQQIDLCYLIPMFKEVLDFRTYCLSEAEQQDRVSDIVSGRTFGNRYAGIAAVANTGNDSNWTGNTLAQANFYGFGRLAFDTELTAEEIAREWIMQAVTEEPQAIQTILNMLLPSREIYEKYTCPLGVGFMVTPNIHYGPNIDGYEYSKWGTYHRADHFGIGVDRTIATGTGYTAQYQGPNVDLYDNPETCPENLLLFFHHLPYTWKMKSGKTMLQHIYDTHFEGVEDVKELIRLWETLNGRISPEIYGNVRARLDRQLDNAREWCDQINSYFYRKTAVPDEHGRKIY